MNRLEAMDRLFKINKAIENQDFVKIVELSGLDEETVDSMSFQDIMDAINVRVADMMRISGLPSEVGE